jgi:hypothetical protein
LVIDLAFVVLFFVAWFVILESLGTFISIPARIAIWLFWAFAFPPPAALTSTEIAALALFSMNLAICLVGVLWRLSPFWFGLASGLCMGGCAAMRYAYWPLVAVGPLSLAFCTIKPKRSLLLAATINTLVAGCSIAALAVYNQTRSGYVTFLGIPA